MDHELSIPEELQDIYVRLLNDVPAELREDPSLRKMMLVYLKIGGENLVRQHIEIEKLRFKDRTRVPQHPLERICPDDVEMDEEGAEEADDDPDFV